MKKLQRFSALFIAFFLLLTACTKTDISLELALCGSYAVPGMYTHDLKGGTFSCDILDEDSEGRVLYAYTAENIIHGQNETVLVICQKIDSDYVYFYEDKCYLFSGYEDTDIDRLKEQNDWNKPLEQAKLSRRRNTISFDLYLSTDTNLESNQLRSICLKELEIEKQALTEFCVLDTDHNGHSLYFVQAEIDGQEKIYLAIANTDYNISFLLLNNGVLLPDDIAAFKNKNDWQYGFSE